MGREEWLDNEAGLAESWRMQDLSAVNRD